MFRKLSINGVKLLKRGHFKIKEIKKQCGKQIIDNEDQ